MSVVNFAFGPMFIGFIVCSSLYGVSLAQTIFYYRSFPRDRKAMKLLVSAADFIHIILISDVFWQALVYSRLRSADASVSAEQSELPWLVTMSMVLQATRRELANAYIFPEFVSYDSYQKYGGDLSVQLFQVLVILMVQCFFCLRVWRVSCGNKPLVAIIALSALIQFGATISILCAHAGFRNLVHEPLATAINMLARMAVISGIVCDGAIAASLTYYLSSYRTGALRTEPVIQQLVWLSVNTGAVLCLMTVCNWVLFERKTKHAPSSCMAVHFVLTKLYINSLVATLNTRRHFRTVLDRSIVSSSHGFSIFSKIATE
ncbi:hypothetical protein FIBSPDRAFT_1039600 [Athelia psychrophila]|uniref:DUF6534 domain-containing protein n=1 Tax=Athelia psychrophila TaxID=1759441 RepID=A0A166RNW3_9AGAM|nr:hypothetical protein FIBSPDRAFT_1039600 [Fibularhizoctonia sp. CBS 109695]